jgi:hypothetical protein
LTESDERALITKTQGLFLRSIKSKYGSVNKQSPLFYFI